MTHHPDTTFAFAQASWPNAGSERDPPTEETVFSALFNVKAQWPFPVRTTEGPVEEIGTLGDRTTQQRPMFTKRARCWFPARSRAWSAQIWWSHQDEGPPASQRSDPWRRSRHIARGRKQDLQNRVRKISVSPGKNANGHLTLKAHQSTLKMMILL